MIINHNLAAMNTYRQYTINNNSVSSSLEKLSSGLRINSAADDAAGLAISEKMRGQIRGLDQASSNAQDGISMIQTAEGALSETESILQRMRELATQSANDTNTESDRAEIQKEMNQLTSEINRIGNTTEFNTQKLLNATSGDVTAAGTTTATAGVYTASAVGTTDVVIDGVTLTYDAAGDGSVSFKDAATLVTLISNDATLSTKYTASTGGSDLVLTQNAGYESATAPTITGAGTVTTTTAGVAATSYAASSSFTMQIGANAGQSFTLSIDDMRADALDISSTTASDTKTFTVDGKTYTAQYTATAVVTNGTDDDSTEYALDVSTSDNATAAIEVLDDAINAVSAERSNLGAYQNRLEHTINNLGTSSENMSAAESRIRDVDMAEEMMNYQKTSVLQQAAQAMLAQANQQPQNVLKLLQ